MMKLSQLQQICLQKMGISVFEMRIKADFDYLVCIEEAITHEKKQLLLKILVALRWPIEKCEIIWAVEAIEQKVAQSVFRKAIVFSERVIASTTSMIVLPSLNTLLINMQAKKAAWQKMQPFISPSA